MARGTIAGEQPRWLTDTEQRAWRSYLRGGHLVMEALDRDLTPYGISLSEYEIISMLSEEPQRRMRMSELAQIVVQSRSRLTHTANRLADRGWVTREPCPDDRRGVLLVLTSDGFAMVQVLAPVHLASVRANLLDLLTADQFEDLGTAMEVLRRHHAGEGDGPMPGGGAG